MADPTTAPSRPLQYHRRDVPRASSTLAARPGRDIGARVAGALAIVGVVPGAAGCTTAATQFIVTVSTDLPPGSVVELRASVADSAGHAGDALLAPRATNADAGVVLPASFGIVPGAIPRDGTFRVTVTARLASASPTAPNLPLVWNAFLTFVPGLTQRAQVFLSRACSVVVSGCARTPADRCTRSALCDEAGMTCDPTGTCVAVPMVPIDRDAGAVHDTAVTPDACIPRCAGRVCGPDGCGGQCGACMDSESCDSTAGQCVPVGPSCGHLGEACCMGMSTSCLDVTNTACDVNRRCVPCGGRLQPCCAGARCASMAMCTVGVCAPCGAVGEACCPGAPACIAPAYCQGGRCWDLPTLTDPGPEGPGCVDFGVAHASLSWTVRGRPGALGEKHVVQISCAGAVDAIPSDGCFTIGADGTFSGPLSNPVITDCQLSAHGQWRSYVIVDGQRSADSRVVYFNSTCAALRTCTLGETFCPAMPVTGGRPSCP